MFSRCFPCNWKLETVSTILVHVCVCTLLINGYDLLLHGYRQIIQSINCLHANSCSAKNSVSKIARCQKEPRFQNA